MVACTDINFFNFTRWLDYSHTRISISSIHLRNILIDLMLPKYKITFQRIKNTIILSVIILFFIPDSFPQQLTVDKIEPPNWWVGMKWNKIQLMVYGENLGNAEIKFSDDRLRVTNIQSVENTNYLFVDVLIPDDIREDNYTLIFKKGNNEISVEYPILMREFPAESHIGFNNEDVIYLIFADRFCDGNPSILNTN